MRFAVVGTNFISDRFCEAARLVEGAEVAAVCSRKYDTGSAFSQKHGIERVYSDYLRLLNDESIDAIYVATPTYTHYDYAARALLAKKAVLCEKMMCPTYGETVELIKLSRVTGKLLVEAMRPDFDPAYDAVRHALSRIGRIFSADFSFFQYSSRYDKFKSGEYTRAFDPKIKNSALSDIGIYPLHMALSLFGEPGRVSSESQILKGGFEGAGEISLIYPDFTAKVRYSKIEDPTGPSVIVGEGGRVFIDKISSPKRVWIEAYDGKTTEIPVPTPENNMIYEIAAFMKMAKGELSPAPYLDLTELTAKVISEVYVTSGISDYF